MHLYASGGAGLLLPSLPYTRPAFRVGLSLYGYGASGVLPAMALYARVVGGFTLRRGERVGYGGTYRAPCDTYTAVLSIGYADGLPRIHRGMTLYTEDGRPLSVLGRVSMNHTVVRDAGEARLSREDRVTVFGMDGKSLLALSESGGRIPYEMLLMGSRARRTYIE
jgi:alanine racemase